MTHQEQIPSADEVEQAVERVCELGCAAVYRVLEAVDDGREPEPLAGLAPELRSRVVLELRSIMAVYDARDGGASCKLGS